MRKNIRLINCFIILFFCSFLLVSTFKIRSVSANSFNDDKSNMEMHSNFIIDAQDFMIEEKSYTVMLNSDLIYVIDDQTGLIIKKLNYTKQQNFLSEYIANAKDSQKVNFSIDDISIEVVKDIDGQGFPDFLVLAKNFTIDEMQSVVAISYEDNRVLWEYTPTMKSIKTCRNFNGKCDEPVTISNYELEDDSLYLSAGYNLEQIDIETGKIKAHYQYDNNIWDFEFVSDLNNDEMNDLALAVQPTKVIYIDGNTFEKLYELEIAKNLRVEEWNIRRNVWDLEFLPTQNILLAASEDGYVYEISVDKKRITKSTKFFDDSADQYKSFIKNQRKDLYEVHKTGKSIFYTFGKATKPLTYIDVHITNSFDTDELQDYIVSYSRKSKSKKTYAKCSSSLDRCEITQYADDSYYFQEFIDANKDHVIYKNPYGTVYIKNLKTDELLLSSTNTTFFKRKSLYFDTEPDFKLFPTSQGYITQYKFNYVMNFSNDGTFESPEWLIYRVNKQTFEATENRLMVLNTSTDYTDQQFNTSFSLYNKANEQLIKHFNSDYIITDYFIEKGQLYIYAKQDIYYMPDPNAVGDRMTFIYDVNTGEKISEQTIDYKQHIENLTYVKEESATLYDDVNKDGYNELLIKVHYFDEISEEFYSAFIFYDCVNNEVLTIYYDDHLRDIKHSFLYNDTEYSDSPRDLVTYSYNQQLGKSIVNQLRISKDYFTDINKSDFEPHIVKYELDVNLTHHYVDSIRDLDDDGTLEIILNPDVEIDDKNENLNKSYILNLQNDSRIVPYTNEFNNAFGYKFISSQYDLNQDGITELIVIDRKTNEFNKRGHDVKLKILNYKNGTLSTVFRRDLLINKSLYEDMNVSKLVSLIDYNNDGTMELFFVSEQEDNNLLIQVFDFSTNELVKQMTVNLDDKSVQSTQEVNLKTGKIIANDLEYLSDTRLLKISKSDYSIFINLKDYRIVYLTGNNCIGTFGNKLLFLDQYNYVLQKSTPIEFYNMSGELKGLYNNVLDYKVEHSLDIQQIKVNKDGQTYTKFKENEIKTRLPEGRYQLIISTTDGGVYLYEFIIEETTMVYKIIQIGTVLALSSGVYFTSRFLIHRRYMKKFI